jgi:hypothetical protein
MTVTVTVTAAATEMVVARHGGSIASESDNSSVDK